MEKYFCEAFIEQLAATGAKVTEVARATGVSKESLYSLKYKKTLNMNVDDAIKVARYFGQSVEQFMGIEDRQTANDRLQDLAKQLTPQEHEILSASIEAIVAARIEEQSIPVPDEQ